MERFTRQVIIRPILVLTALMAAFEGDVHAAGLNTDVALTPPEGGTIVRVQWRFSELSKDSTPMDREADMSVYSITVVHGFTSDFTVLATLPVMHREIDFGMTGAEVQDTGIADIPLLAKYRFYQHDEPGRTTRWVAIAGLELPTYDKPFSSESFDPIIGTVWTHQRLDDWWLDWDVLYKFNTGGGIDGDDELRGDLALSYQLLAGKDRAIGTWSLYAIGEINAKYLTDGSTQVFGSPGIQFITPQWILETGVQLPIHQDMNSPRLETDFTFILSVRFQF